MKRFGKSFINKNRALKNSKTNNNSDSIYIPINTSLFLGEFKEFSRRKCIEQNFIIEIDEHSKRDKTYHFHVWNASENRCRLSDCRSEGIDLFSILHNLESMYVKKEDRDNKTLKDIEKQAIVEFFKEDIDRHLALYLMIFAKKKGLKIEKPSFSTHGLKIDFSEKELLEASKEYFKLSEASKKQNALC